MADFATAEEAALYVARSPEGQAVAVEQAAAAAPLKSEEARQQAQAEGLTLRVAKSKTGYLGVHHKPGRSKPNNKTGFSGVHHQPGKSKPYKARAWRNGKQVYLGSFVTAEEAALCVARPNQLTNRQAMAALDRAAEARKAAASMTALHAPAEGLTLLEEAIARRAAPPAVQAVAAVDAVEERAADESVEDRSKRQRTI